MTAKGKKNIRGSERLEKEKLRCPFSPNSLECVRCRLYRQGIGISGMNCILIELADRISILQFHTGIKNND